MNRASNKSALHFGSADSCRSEEPRASSRQPLRYLVGIGIIREKSRVIIDCQLNAKLVVRCKRQRSNLKFSFCLQLKK